MSASAFIPRMHFPSQVVQPSWRKGGVEEEGFALTLAHQESQPGLAETFE